MKNILSYNLNTRFTGKEIKDWIRFHLNNKTSHTKQAYYLKKFLNLKDNKIYKLQKGDYRPSASYNKFIFTNNYPNGIVRK